MNTQKTFTVGDKFTISQFLKRFPNDDTCLEEIKTLRWPNGLIPCNKCNKDTSHYKVTGRTAYACQFCGTHIYPTAGTIFDKSTTPLRLWFYAIYLMAQTRAGISAKQLQRELGVTYKTAWRMFKQIRALMADKDGTPLDGIVEIDETFIGGKTTNRKNVYGHGSTNKEVVMGMVQRDGKAYLKHVPNTGKWTLLKQIKENVSPRASVYTDEFGSYIQLPNYGYFHDWVTHSKSEYARGDVHTQNIENIWSHLKRGITGVYRNVSKKYLQAYVDEYAFRYNNRRAGGYMFDLILKQVPEVKMLRS
ncbi:MAG: IS1595 family transposase [Candidatus Curtissbacteria bacterium]|nr:IS1595 family transposase [Candidatus Curtissbacteria bacterium]